MGDLSLDHAAIWEQADVDATNEVSFLYPDDEEHKEVRYNKWLRLALKKYNQMTEGGGMDNKKVIKDLEDASAIMAAGMGKRQLEWEVSRDPEHGQLVVMKVENSLLAISYITGYWDSMVSSVKGHGYLADRIKGWIALPEDDS